MKVILLGSFAGNNAGHMVVLESIIHDFIQLTECGIQDTKQSLFRGMGQGMDIELVVPALNEKGIGFLNRVIGNHKHIMITPVPIEKDVKVLVKAVKSLVSEFASADFIYTTAGILFEQKIWNPLYNFVAAYTPFLVWAKKVNPTVRIIGYNVGITSQKRSAGSIVLKKCIGLHDCIYLREEKDEAVLKSLQYKGRIYHSADNVFGFKSPKAPHNSRKQKKKIYINLTLYGVEDKKQFLHEMIRFVKGMKQDYDIYFFQTSTRDMEPAKIVCERACIDEKHIIFLGLLGYDRIQELLSDCDVLIGMRMHSIIFALKGGCPVVAIQYSSKVKSLMQTIQLDNWLIGIRDVSAETLAAKVDGIIKQRDAVTKHIYCETERLYLACNKYK